ncbi:MAG: nuclear transport factor 2 family protein [Mycobacteriales bacterium]
MRDLLEALSDAVERRDLVATLALWADDGVLAGAAEGELALGPAIREFLELAYGMDLTMRWDWEPPVVRREGDLAWFFVEGRVFVDGTKPRPYRASGVLRRLEEGWRFALWHGSEPAA